MKRCGGKTIFMCNAAPASWLQRTLSALLTNQVSPRPATIEQTPKFKIPDSMPSAPRDDGVDQSESRRFVLTRHRARKNHINAPRWKGAPRNDSATPSQLNVADLW